MISQQCIKNAMFVYPQLSTHFDDKFAYSAASEWRKL